MACQIPKIIDDYPSSDGEQLFQWITSASSRITEPDLTFLLDVDSEILKERIIKRGEQVSESDIVVFKRRKAIYDRLASENKKRWITFPNNRSPSEAAQAIANRVFTPCEVRA